MKKRIIYCGLGVISFFVLINSCMKETYDFDKLSTQATIDVGFSMPVLKGSLTLGNAIESNDTIRFLMDNSISIVFKQDSLFTFDVSEILEIPVQQQQNQTFMLGGINLNDFSGTGAISLNDISAGFNPALQAALQALDGTTSIFPAIPSSPGMETNISPFSNFTQVEFGSGTIMMTITNNLPVPINLFIIIKNASDGSLVGDPFTFTDVLPGATDTSTTDLTGVVATSTLIAQLVSISSPGSSPNAVPISLNDEIEITVESINVTVVSGQAILPDQLFVTSRDTIQVSLDNNEEITLIEMNTGHIDYTLNSGLAENAQITITLPTSKINNDTTRFTISLGTAGPQSGQLSLDNSITDLSTDPGQPFNTIPFEYKLELISSGGLIFFDLTDSITLSYGISDIEFSYVEGYFGQQNFNVDEDSIDFDFGEIEDNISGTITVTDPNININITNSIGLPVSIDLDLSGSNGAGDTQDLNASTMNIDYPADRDNSPVISTSSFNKDNTDIVSLIEIRPSKIIYTGGVTVNPLGNQGRDNFVTSESSVVASLEIEIPLSLRANNLTFQDTLDNPMKLDDGKEQDFSFDFIESATLHLQIDNGFPLEIGFSIQLYDSVTNQVLASVDIPNLFPAAPVDANGDVTEVISDTTSIVIAGDFLENLETADKMIITASLNTSENGAQGVRLLTTYTIDFKLGVSTEVSYEFDFGK